MNCLRDVPLWETLTEFSWVNASKFHLKWISTPTDFIRTNWNGLKKKKKKKIPKTSFKGFRPLLQKVDFNSFMNSSLINDNFIFEIFLFDVLKLNWVDHILLNFAESILQNSGRMCPFEMDLGSDGFHPHQIETTISTVSFINLWWMTTLSSRCSSSTYCNWTPASESPSEFEGRPKANEIKKKIKDYLDKTFLFCLHCSSVNRPLENEQRR